MKKFYGSPWFIWAIAIVVMALTGTLNAAALIVLSLFALALLGRSPRGPHAGRKPCESGEFSS